MALRHAGPTDGLGDRAVASDILFLLVVMVSAATLLGLVAAALGGRWRFARRLLRGYALVAFTYLGALVLFSLTAPQRVLPLGEDRCFDDWCIAATGYSVLPELGPSTRRLRAQGRFYAVEIRLSNQARGRSQRASSVALWLLDDRGRRYPVSRSGQAAWEAEHGPTAALTSTLALGERLGTLRVFEVPLDARSLGLVVEHPAGFSPGRLILFDEQSWLHPPTVFRLAP